MQKLTDSLPSANAGTPPPTRPSPNYSDSLKAQKTKAIQTRLQECHDVFEVYKDHESIGGQIKAFYTVLQPHDIVDINAAFDEWLREGEKFPTPAAIYAICGRIVSDRYKIRGPVNVLPDPADKARAEKPKRAPEPAPSWSGKQWKDMTDADRAALLKHLDPAEWRERAQLQAAKRFFHDFMGVPNEFMGREAPKDEGPRPIATAGASEEFMAAFQGGSNEAQKS